MITRLHTAIVVFTILASGIAWGDVIVRAQMFEVKGAVSNPASPMNAPADLPRGEPVATVETLTDAGGNFLARVSQGKQIMELKGSVQQLQNDLRRVRVSFSNNAEQSTRHVTTNIELPLDQPRVIGGLLLGTGQGVIVLTIANDAAK